MAITADDAILKVYPTDFGLQSFNGYYVSATVQYSRETWLMQAFTQTLPTVTFIFFRNEKGEPVQDKTVTVFVSAIKIN